MNNIVKINGLYMLALILVSHSALKDSTRVWDVGRQMSVHISRVSYYKDKYAPILVMVFQTHSLTQKKPEKTKLKLSKRK